MYRAVPKTFYGRRLQKFHYYCITNFKFISKNIVMYVFLVSNFHASKCIKEFVFFFSKSSLHYKKKLIFSGITTLCSYIWWTLWKTSLYIYLGMCIVINFIFKHSRIFFLFRGFTRTWYFQNIIIFFILRLLAYFHCMQRHRLENQSLMQKLNLYFFPIVLKTMIKIFLKKVLIMHGSG